MKAVALVDGDHAPEVVRAALAHLPYEFVGVILVGGGEKLRGDADYGAALLEGFADAEVVVDLADAPALTASGRRGWIVRALAAGLPYHASGLRIDPPALEPLALPSIAVIGTGKRVGKTAVTVHLARALSAERAVVCVCMGRGGPPQPELRECPPTLPELLALSRSGRHAASDYLEVALLAEVPTVGCSRAGGGPAGAVAYSNLAEGARLAEALGPDVVIFDGSGSAIPPVAVERRVLVVGPGHDFDAGLNAYHRLVADIVVAVGCELEGAIPAALRLAPQGPVAGRVAVFTAGATDVSHLDGEVVSVSASLGERATLAAELPRIQADTYLTELKGAAVELVCEDALARGREVVFAGNEVVSAELDDALGRLVPAAVGL